MKLTKVTEDDLGVIGNYLIELMEQNKLDNIKEVVSSIDKVLLSNESWKVEVGDKIVAFACVEEIDSEVAKVANFYVAPEYRQTKAVYLMYTKTLELLKPYRIAIANSLGGTHNIESRFCNDGKIDIEGCTNAMERFKKRWEVVQKQ